MHKLSLQSFCFLLAFSVTLFIFPYTSTAQPEYETAFTLHAGELNGAPYKVAVPENWTNGNVFFHVHGWRPANAPHEADLNMENPFYRELIDVGWAIARTAFYENGVDNEEHIRALRELTGWITSEIGPVGRVVMEGEYTAGSLVLRIA